MLKMSEVVKIYRWSFLLFLFYLLFFLRPRTPEIAKGGARARVPPPPCVRHCLQWPNIAKFSTFHEWRKSLRKTSIISVTIIARENTCVCTYCCRQTAWYPNFLRCFFRSLDEKPRIFGSEHFSTCPKFHYLDILLPLKYLTLARIRCFATFGRTGGWLVRPPPLGVSKRSVVELSGKDQQVSLA